MSQKRPAELSKRPAAGNGQADLFAADASASDRGSVGEPSRVEGRMLAHEKAGTLLPRLKEQADLETQALAESDSPDYAHLADHEKMALFGPPQGL
jgi:hypothetical protein